MLKLVLATCLAVIFWGQLAVSINAQEAPEKATPAVAGVVDGASNDWVLRAKRILEIGAESSLDAKQKSKLFQELSSLKPPNDADPRYGYSFILVAMKEKQWPSAQKLVTELLERHGDYLPARVAKARMLLTLEKKLAAVAELELLAKGLEAPSATISSDQLTDAARFLGLAVGYFEGPGKDSIKAMSLQALVDKTDNIPQSLQEPFSQAKLATLNDYQILVEKGEEALAEFKKGLAEDSERMRAELEAQREKTAKDAQVARQQLETNWAQAKTAWEAAWARSQTLSQNANVLQVQRGQLASNLAVLRPPSVNSEGNVDRNDERRYLDAKRQLESSMTNIDFQLGNFAAEYDAVGRKGMAIENQMNTLRAEAQRLGMNLAAQDGSFAKADKMIRGKEQSAQKAEPKLMGNKLRQSRAFATYDEFNYYREKTLLTDSFPRD